MVSDGKAADVTASTAFKDKSASRANKTTDDKLAAAITKKATNLDMSLPPRVRDTGSLAASQWLQKILRNKVHQESRWLHCCYRAAPAAEHLAPAASVS